MNNSEEESLEDDLISNHPVDEVTRSDAKFECVYCDKSFAMPSQSTDDIHLYKEHLAVFHQIIKNVNKIIHNTVSKEYEPGVVEGKCLVTRPEKEILRTENNSQKSNSVHTQTCPKDFYRHFMQNWDTSIDWKLYPKPGIVKPKNNLNKKKESALQNGENNIDGLPIIRNSLSLKAEAFERLGMNTVCPSSFVENETEHFKPPINKLDTNIIKTESPSKVRELNINDWTRPVKSYSTELNKSLKRPPNKAIVINASNKDCTFQDKYTFSVINEPSTKRQKILVKFKKDLTDDLLTTNQISIPAHSQEAGVEEQENETFHNGGNEDGLNHPNSINGHYSNIALKIFEDSTSKIINNLNSNK